MIGFELIHKEDTITATIKEGSFSVTVDRIVLDDRNCLTIGFGGYDIENDTYPCWYEKGLYLGDELNVKIKNITKNSPIIQRKDEQEFFFRHTAYIGIELMIGEECVEATVEKGSVHLIASILNKGGISEIDIDFLANDYNSNKQYWYKKRLQLGDSFSIKVKEVKNISIPLKL